MMHVLDARPPSVRQAASPCHLLCELHAEADGTALCSGALRPVPQRRCLNIEHPVAFCFGCSSGLLPPLAAGAAWRRTPLPLQPPRGPWLLLSASQPLRSMLQLQPLQARRGPDLKVLQAGPLAGG